MIATAPPATSESVTEPMSGQMSGWKSFWERMEASSSASRPVGARSRIRSPGATCSSCLSVTGAGAFHSQQRLPLPHVVRHPGENPLELPEWLPDADPPVGDLELADGQLMRAAALLQHRNRLADLAHGFKESEHQEAVRQVAHLGLARGGRGEHAMLSQGQERGCPPLRQVAQELVQPDVEQTLLQHRVQIAVQTIDD